MITPLVAKKTAKGSPLYRRTGENRTSTPQEGVPLDLFTTRGTFFIWWPKSTSNIPSYLAMDMASACQDKPQTGCHMTRSKKAPNPLIFLKIIVGATSCKEIGCGDGERISLLYLAASIFLVPQKGKKKMWARESQKNMQSSFSSERIQDRRHELCRRGWPPDCSGSAYQFLPADDKINYSPRK